MVHLEKRGIVSFPKCGRTWIRLFLDYYQRFAGLNRETIKLRYRHDDKFAYDRRLVLMRHPCDVMVSYWLHKSYRGKMKVPMAQFVRHRKKGIPMFNRWYVKWSRREEGQMEARYEDLFDRETWLKILGFFGIPLDDEAIDKSFEMTRFDTIRKNLHEIAHFKDSWRYLAAQHGRYRVVEPRNPEMHKFRRGKVGGYVDYLCDGDIDYILENFTLGERWEHHRQWYLKESEKHRAVARSA